MGSKSGAPNETGLASAESHSPGRIECCTSLESFFHDTLRSALASRGVDAPPPTEHYLVDMLADLGHDETVLSRSLVELTLHAQAVNERARLAQLRAIGDQALSVSGLFEAHLERHGISASYVVEVGSRAYRGASQLASASSSTGERARAAVFYDLGSRFQTYAHVLDDVREATALGTRDDVLSLYERYTKTRSKAVLDRLLDRGVLPTFDEGEGRKPVS